MAVSTRYTNSTAIVYLLLGEGPIKLKNGLASIYLNRTPISNSSVQSANLGRDAAVFLNNTGTATMLGFASVGIPGIFPMLLKGANKIATVSISANSTTVNTTSSFFTPDMLANDSDGDGGLFQKVRIAGAGANGGELEAEIIQIISPTQAILDRPAINAVTNGFITWDHFTYASESPVFGNNSIQLFTPVPRTDLRNNPASPSTSWVPVLATLGNGSTGLNSAINDDLNFKNVRVNFRSGTLDQAPVQNTRGFSSASSGISPGVAINQVDSVPNGSGSVTIHGTRTRTFWGGQDTATNIKPDIPDSGGIVITSGSGTTGLNIANPGEVDEISINIAFPSGMYAFKAKDNSYGNTGAVFQIYFEYKVASSPGYTSKLIFGPSSAEIASRAQGLFVNDAGALARGWYPTGTVKSGNTSSFNQEFRFSINEFKPFDDFRVRICKLTPNSFEANGWTHTCDCVLANVQAFINDKLSYPYSAYLALEFNSQEFEGQYPEVAVHCYGIDVDVPTNYVTRQEASDGVAKYTRNSSGVETSSYVRWNGSFRRTYCDNPVWVIRELLLNKRFGLGNWLSESELNNFALYSLARYCDELVPDGEGGLEPRFTVSAYLTQSTEAYKVVKDFFSTLLAIPYWVDGKLMPVGDRPGSPIYNFTKGNIEGGIFSYEGTGSKVRPNQVAVTYNDRDFFYEQRVEIVDDIENIIETGRVITDEVVAFGATSRGQATRYGRWKMLTAKLQKEVVSFKTAENAVFLKPGDIITVQDSDRNRIRYSGRIAASTTTSVTLDSPVTLFSGESYSLYVMVAGPATYLAQKSAIIGGNTYSFGDMLPVFNQEDAENLTDDNGDAVSVQFTADQHLEERVITNSPGANQTVLNVSAPFSEAPTVEFIWALTARNPDGIPIQGSPKEYKILNIVEEASGVYSITAAEHFNAKFDLVNEDYLVEPITEIPRYGDIPAPRDFTAGLVVTNVGSDSSNSAINPRILLSWRPPIKLVQGLEQPVDNLDNYILVIQSPNGSETRVIVPNSATSYTINNPEMGVYSFTLQSASIQGPVSRPKYASIVVQLESVTPGLAAQLKLLRGGEFTRPPLVDDDIIRMPQDYDYTNPVGTRVRVRNGSLT